MAGERRRKSSAMCFSSLAYAGNRIPRVPCLCRRGAEPPAETAAAAAGGGEGPLLAAPRVLFFSEKGLDSINTETLHPAL